jgi:CelD/BcsL family acetyltransferase involved in cellulose biosynthesis
MRVLDPLRDPAWAALVARAPEATIFHHPAWLALLHAQYGYALEAWCDDSADAGLPVALVRSRLTGTRLVALPFSDACPPLVAAGADAAGARLAAGLGPERARRGLDLEIRGDAAGAGAHRGAEFAEHRLDLRAGLDAVRAGFHKGQVQRAIKRAAREGVTVEHATSRQALERFYALHVATRRTQGVPTQPKRFVLNFAGLFAAGLGFVALARHEDRDVAAAVFLRAGSTLTYKYGASDREHLGVRPNHAIFDHAIAWACAEGLHTLDYGRTDLDNDGLRSFKRGWGAEERPLRYHVLADAPPNPGRGRADRLLAALITRSPPSVGRAVGEALYRHAG